MAYSLLHLPHGIPTNTNTRRPNVGQFLPIELHVTTCLRVELPACTVSSGMSLEVSNKPMPLNSFDNLPSLAFGSYDSVDTQDHLRDLSSEDIAILACTFPGGNIGAENDFNFLLNPITNFPAFSSNAPDTQNLQHQADEFASANWTGSSVGNWAGTVNTAATSGQSSYATTLTSVSAPTFAPAPIPAAASNGLVFLTLVDDGPSTDTTNALRLTRAVHTAPVSHMHTPVPDSRAKTPLQAGRMVRTASVSRLQTPTPGLRVETHVQRPTGYQPYPSPGLNIPSRTRPLIRSVSSPLKAGVAHGVGAPISHFASAPNTPPQITRRLLPPEHPNVAPELGQQLVSHPGTPTVTCPGTPVNDNPSTRLANESINSFSAPAPHFDTGCDIEFTDMYDQEPNIEDEGNVRDTEHIARRAVSPPQPPFNQIDLSVEVDGFLSDVGDVPQPITPDRIVRSSNSKAPTRLEMEMHQADECEKLRESRKSSDKSGTKNAKGIFTVGSYSEKEQSYMALMRAHLYWDLVHLSPWSEHNNNLIKRAQEYASKVTNWAGDEIVTVEFKKTVRSRF